MHHQEGNTKPKDIVLSTCSLQLGEWAYITAGCGKKMQKYVLKISGNSHFDICHYAMPCHREQ